MVISILKESNIYGRNTYPQPPPPPLQNTSREKQKFVEMIITMK
jgi:hypothetical protein